MIAWGSIHGLGPKRGVESGWGAVYELYGVRQLGKRVKYGLASIR